MPRGTRSRALILKMVEASRVARLALGRTLAVRFWEKVNKDGPIHPELGTPCWLWTGGLKDEKPTQHGQIWDSGKVRPAHQVSLQLHGVEIDKSKVIDHICREPICVNPAHLRQVNHRTNAVENNASPFAANAAKTRCKYGHLLEGDNLALYTPKHRTNRHGKKYVSGPTRVCLTCRPTYWRWAAVPRDPPSNAVFREGDSLRNQCGVVAAANVVQPRKETP